MEMFTLKGTALSGDNFWKGIYGHVTASYIANYYACPDPYAVTEMEDIAVANTAACFDMLDRVVALRAIVNTDIFEPAMHTLLDAGSIIIDGILDGSLSI